MSHTCRRILFFNKDQNLNLIANPLNQRVQSGLAQTPDFSTANLSSTPSLRRAMEQNKLFKKLSTWNPPLGPLGLETFLTLHEIAVNNFTPRAPKKQNLTKACRKALEDLSKDNSIVLKQANKGGAFVIWGRDDYITEAHRQLGDAMFYCKQACDMTLSNTTLVNRLVDRLLSNNEIDAHMHKMLVTTDPRTPEFYLLPKIHKGKTPCPGRPIISGNGGPTEKISGFIDLILRPLVPKIKSYIKDTAHFLQLIDTHKTCKANTLLVTMDVTSLYTNIPNHEGKRAIRTALESANQPRSSTITRVSTSSILEILGLVLERNNFSFNGEHFLQVGGTAMGTRVAPTYANLYMDWFETKHIYTYPLQPTMFGRYIDDIFLLWDHGRESLDAFLTHINSIHPTIKFSAEISAESVSFLDTQVVKGPDNILFTDLYCKPADANNYLHYNSSHWMKCKDSIVYSQFIRIRRICSNIKDFDKHCLTKALHFKRRAYPVKVIISAFKRARQMDRNALVFPAPADHKPPDTPKVIAVTQYHPTCRVFEDSTRRNWDLLGRSTTTRYLFEHKLIVAYKRPKNLGEGLIRARLPQLRRVSGPAIARPSCTTKNCRYCPIINKTGRIKSKTTARSYVCMQNSLLQKQQSGLLPQLPLLWPTVCR